MRHRILVCLALLISSCSAQTTTVLNAAGNTVVELITTNADGDSTTRTVRTLGVTPTPTDRGQGPVAVPAPTVGTPHAPIPYTYITQDAQGRTITVADTFTPSFTRGQVSPTLASGTVLGYTEWLSMIGSNTVPPARNDALSRNLRFAFGGGWLGGAFGLVGGAVGGAWLVLM